MRVYGTRVKNPTARYGVDGYSKCRHCGKYYTRLGISRHWDRCPKRLPLEKDTKVKL